jgi:hypothetical protein
MNFYVRSSFHLFQQMTLMKRLYNMGSPKDTAVLHLNKNLKSIKEI